MKAWRKWEARGKPERRGRQARYQRKEAVEWSAASRGVAHHGSHRSARFGERGGGGGG